MPRSLGEIKTSFLAKYDEIAVLDEKLEAAKAELAALDAELQAAFVEAGVSTVKNTDGRVLYLRGQLWARAKNGDRLAVTKALRHVGAGDLVTEGFNANQLSAYVREMVRAGEEIDPVLLDAIVLDTVYAVRVKSR